MLAQMTFTIIDYLSLYSPILSIQYNSIKEKKMSDSASFTSGPSPATSTHHGYKKSLSSKADPNTALNEHQPSTPSSPINAQTVRNTNKNSGQHWVRINLLPPLHPTHRPRGACHHRTRPVKPHPPPLRAST